MTEAADELEAIRQKRDGRWQTKTLHLTRTLPKMSGNDD